MMAAIAAAVHSAKASVVLIEKNEKLGKKLYLTGKGRCNITNAATVEGLLAHVPRNPRFLYSAFNQFDSSLLMSFIEGLGVPLKVERGNRVFPVSDKANDINRALEARLRELGVAVRLRTAVGEIVYNDGFTVVIKNNFQVKTNITVDAVILATGGLSYPSTGATGEGFLFARELGHTVVPTYPSLVPLLSDEPWLLDLAGLSLRNVRLSARLPDGKVLYEETGEMLFTPEGVSGPLVLRASAYMADRIAEKPYLSLDVKPGLSREQLDARILRDFAEQKNKDFINALGGLLPQSMVPVVVRLCGIPPDMKVNAVTRTQRTALAQTLKNITINPTETAGYSEAVITRGGIDTREVNPSTLMSKKIPGLFFAGECLDVDALTGGYNLQIAFSTGYLAGKSAVSSGCDAHA
ncbi:MAG: NAD(P)/FAD-dependent oxidoreductase [Defluviitaleaceae bacterium]|nr:NAD(P)/FAD-dependent oxidoreductase [Defluviitaleaceae bacterium]